MSLRKLGRPPEDRLLRQREIYQAASPLIREQGVRVLSMRDVADVACLSIGGLYHYFPTKRDLILHGIQIETLQRFCEDFHQHFTDLVHSNPQQYFEVFYHHLVDSALFLQRQAYGEARLCIRSKDISI